MRTGAGTCSTPRAGLSLSAFTARRKGTRGSRDMEVRELSPKGPPVEQIPGAPCTNQALAGGPGVSRPDYTERPLVTQTARCERISHTRLKHSFSAACGNRANFCDANWLYTRAGWRRGMRWSAPVDGAWDRSYTSGIALPPGNFGLSDLEVIEKRGNRGWHVLYTTGRRLFRAGRDCIDLGDAS